MIGSTVIPYGARFLSVLQTTGLVLCDKATTKSDISEAERKERAALRRLAAGEQRKRASRISDALRDGGFALRYLPRLDLGEDDRIVSAELWLGLPNRRRGFVSVAPILRNLDRESLRSEMLRFTLQAAAAEVATWPAIWRIAVPVPGRTLGDGMVCQAVLNALREAGIGKDRLDVLIDEAELVEGGSGLHQQVVALREQGLGVTLEGFGAIFGSLALLPRLPLTGLKLDRRLAHAAASGDHADEITLIRASVEIARRFEVAVTIDGIETELELQRVRELGVDQAQGPWIGPAMPAETMRARIRRAG